MGLLPDLSMHRLHHPPHTSPPCVLGISEESPPPDAGKTAPSVQCRLCKHEDPRIRHSDIRTPAGACTLLACEQNPAGSSPINICKTEPQLLQKKRGTRAYSTCLLWTGLVFSMGHNCPSNMNCTFDHKPGQLLGLGGCVSLTKILVIYYLSDFVLDLPFRQQIGAIISCLSKF